MSTEFGVDAPPVPSQARLVPEIASRLRDVLPRVAQLHDYQYHLLKYYMEHYRMQKYAPCGGYFQFMCRVDRKVGVDTDFCQFTAIAYSPYYEGTITSGSKWQLGYQAETEYYESRSLLGRCYSLLAESAALAKSSIFE